MELSKRRKFEQYQDRIARLYPELIETKEGDSKTGTSFLSRTVTFQVTDNCNLACKYCYQINKGIRKMSFETAKKFVDLLLTGEKGMNTYVDPSYSPALIIEFIGGEPFLEIELIDKISDYFFHKAIELEHPWAEKHMFSICSNGILYSDPRVQAYLKKHKDNLSFSVTIDGNKELHDSCRVFPNGDPSYDIAVAAAKDWMSKGYYMGSKITIAPGNIQYTFSAIKHMVELGYEDINANCVYEKGWELHHAQELYKQLKQVVDYLYEEKKMKEIYISLFMEDFFKPKEENDLTNWCGGTGLMLSCDPDGYFYPCIRYMESSLGDDRPPLRIGDVDTGIAQCEEHKNCIECLNKIDRRTESTDECFYCPIAEGCSWCSAYNYQIFGTPDSRVTYICEMHKARALANAYYWSKYHNLVDSNTDVKFELWIPEQWAIPIVGKEEWEFIKSLPHIDLKNPDNEEEIRNYHR